MEFDPVARLVAYHRAINALDFAAIEAMFAAYTDHDSGGLGGVASGRDRIMKGFRTCFDAHLDQVAEHRLAGPGEEIVTFDASFLILRVEASHTSP